MGGGDREDAEGVLHAAARGGRTRGRGRRGPVPASGLWGADGPPEQAPGDDLVGGRLAGHGGEGRQGQPCV